jgi:murein DD-endopeptidase MepM/ murein hydrolase activator NlpD
LAPYYNFIASKNGIANPNLIYVNQTIFIPREVPAPPVDPPVRTTRYRPYIIKPGDTLWAIAQRYLNNGNRWREISKDLAGTQFFTEAEARLLQVNQTVYLPVIGETGSGRPVIPSPINTTPQPVTWQNPLPGYPVTSGYGLRGSEFHYGIDIGAPQGTPIRAAMNGTVVFAGWNNQGYGNLVILEHSNGTRTYYAHMSTISVSPGMSIAGGSIIGQVGSTGNSTGPHLHFEIRVVPYRWPTDNQNPRNYIQF